MALHHQADQPLPLVGVLGQELLGSGGNGFGIALHLDLRHGFHSHGHALLGVHVLPWGDVK
jgi:hypothetical protein